MNINRIYTHINTAISYISKLMINPVYHQRELDHMHINNHQIKQVIYPKIHHRYVSQHHTYIHTHIIWGI